jgi:hypothetical protein
MKKALVLIFLSLVFVASVRAQEARRRWEVQRQIRLDKFEQVLPQAVRAQGIDMWIVAVKENHLMIDWGVQLMKFGTDVKRVAYVLKPGELVPPKSIQAAFDKAIAVRDLLKKAIKPGVRATSP